MVYYGRNGRLYDPERVVLVHYNGKEIWACRVEFPKYNYKEHKMLWGVILNQHWASTFYQ